MTDQLNEFGSVSSKIGAINMSNVIINSLREIRASGNEVVNIDELIETLISNKKQILKI